MVLVTFQHLTTELHHENGNTDIVLYGRINDGRSVCVRVKECVHHITACYEKNAPNTIELRTMLQWAAQVRYWSKKPYDSNKFHTGLLWLTKKDIDLGARICEGHNIREAHLPKKRFYEYSSSSTYLLSDLEKIILNKTDYQCHMPIRETIASEYDKAFECYDHTRQEYDDDDYFPDKPTYSGSKAMLYESNISHESKFMVHNNLITCGWITAEIWPTESVHALTTCDLEGHCTPKDLRPEHNPPSSMAPFRIYSYDIEAMPYYDAAENKFHFPEPHRDPITTIGVVWFTMTEPNKRHQAVFMFEPDGAQCSTLPVLTDAPDEYDPSHTEVFSFRNEQDMIQGFAEHMCHMDPDFITGYNINSFDNVYMMRRAKRLRSRMWSRRKDFETTVREIYKHSNQKGGRKSYESSIKGRVWADLLPIMLEDHKEKSYKLDYMASLFLQTKKVHIDYEDIPKMQKTAEGRVKLAIYCVKDSWLPCELIVKLSKMINAISMSQVTHVSVQDVLSRGQQIRTLTLMLVFILKRTEKNRLHPRYFIPSTEDLGEIKKFKGALVIKPIKGFYKEPVATLDFASLYPSIMIAYNMCYSTLIESFSEAKRRQLKWSYETHFVKDEESPDYPEVRPVRDFEYPEGGDFKYISQESDICFVTKKKRVGILPEILATLLSERRRVKKLMKQTPENDIQYGVYNGRQLALKVCANSIYGFTGAGKGYLGEKRIASSVTKTGRGMANKSKWMCESKYKQHYVQCVYGDTDSVFIKLPRSLCQGEDEEAIIKRACEIGEEMGKMCTKTFLPPNDLEFEKIYLRLLLKGKKRYFGWKIEPGCKRKLDIKGFECIRRDFCPYLCEIQKKVAVLISKENKLQEAINVTREAVLDFLYNRVPLEGYIMSKKLTKPPEQYDNPGPHVKLALRLKRQFGAAHAPKAGERVEFIYAIPPERGLKSSDCAVSVDTVRNGGAAPDNMYYLENQFKKPMFRIFDLMMDNALDIFKVNGRKKQVIQSSGGIGKFLKIKRKPENPQEDTENPQEAQHNSKKRKTIVMKRNRKKQSMLASYFKK